MKIIRGIATLILIILCAAGCKKAAQPASPDAAPNALPSNGQAATANPSASAATSDEAAIKAAIERHLRENSGLNLAAMETAINTITVEGNKAQANLTFSAKQGGNPMVMVYSLARRGTDWIVVSSEPAGGQFAHPPLDKTHSSMPTNPQSSAAPDLKRFYKNGSSTGQSSAPPAAPSSPQH